MESKKVKKVKKRVFTKEEKIIYEMMTNSNFYKSYLDSSQGVNYAAFRNAIFPIESFFDKPYQEMKICKWGTEYNISSQMLFRNHLSVDKICLKFNKLNLPLNCTEEKEYSWGIESLNEDKDKLDKFIEKYLPSYKVGNEYNTYSNDTYIDCTFQYFTLYNSDNGDDYIAIAFHSGCDVRGGYQPYKLFQVDDFDSFMCDVFEESSYIQQNIARENVKYEDEYGDEIELSEEQFNYIMDTLEYIDRLPFDKANRRYVEMRNIIDNWEVREDMQEYISPEVHNPNQLILFKNV